ncbi:MAG: hypothetical protein ABIA74_00360 [bacterium]
MKKIIQKFFLFISLFFLCDQVNGMKSIEEVLELLNELAGKTKIENEEEKFKKNTDPIRISRKRVSFSGGDENLETLVKQIVLFNNLNLETIEKFENKFMETFSDINTAKNAFAYMKLVVDSHNTLLLMDKLDLNINDLSNGFFKLVWRIKWAEDNKKQKLADHRKRIFNTLITFLTGVTGKFNAPGWKIIQLQQDELIEIAEIIAKIQTFNPDLKWPEGRFVNGFPVFMIE